MGIIKDHVIVLTHFNDGNGINNLVRESSTNIGAAATKLFVFKLFLWFCYPTYCESSFYAFLLETKSSIGSWLTRPN